MSFGGIAEWAVAGAFIAVFALVCRIPVQRCPRGRYACAVCMRLDTPAGERDTRKYLDWAETAGTFTRERS